ncbi:MAG: hypothetical protein ABIA04_06430 [Pseudomonadota bacterium]
MLKLPIALLKLTITVVLTFAFLNIPINDKVIFYHLRSFVKQKNITEKIIIEANELKKEGMKKISETLKDSTDKAKETLNEIKDEKTADKIKDLIKEKTQENQ